MDKNQKLTLVIDIAIPSDGNIRKKKYEKLEKYQELKEEFEKMYKVKTKAIQVIIGTLEPLKVVSSDSRNITDLYPEERITQSN